MYGMIRYVGETIGAVLGGVWLQHQLDRGLPSIRAYGPVFLMIAGLLLVGALLAVGLNDRGVTVDTQEIEA
jgi:hypothetical protein